MGETTLPLRAVDYGMALNEHSKLQVNDANDRIVALCASEGVAAEVVTACNNHDQLVALLTKMIFVHGPRNTQERALEREAMMLLEEIEANNAK